MKPPGLQSKPENLIEILLPIHLANLEKWESDAIIVQNYELRLNFSFLYLANSQGLTDL